MMSEDKPLVVNYVTKPSYRYFDASNCQRPADSTLRVSMTGVVVGEPAVGQLSEALSAIKSGFGGLVTRWAQTPGQLAHLQKLYGSLGEEGADNG